MAHDYDDVEREDRMGKTERKKREREKRSRYPARNEQALPLFYL